MVVKNIISILILNHKLKQLDKDFDRFYIDGYESYYYPSVTASIKIEKLIREKL